LDDVSLRHVEVDDRHHVCGCWRGIRKRAGTAAARGMAQVRVGGGTLRGEDADRMLSSFVPSK
jgi:hypothetical protein